ncbi:hypothetical protein ES703_63786 [subsurface metagenome]
MPAIATCLLAACLAGAAELPTVEVRSDDTAISKSCRVTIPAGAVIEDTNNNGSAARASA